MQKALLLILFIHLISCSEKGSNTTTYINVSSPEEPHYVTLEKKGRVQSWLKKIITLFQNVPSPYARYLLLTKYYLFIPSQITLANLNLGMDNVPCLIRSVIYFQVIQINKLRLNSLKNGTSPMGAILTMTTFNI